eukprot:COSAG06_NODE_24400_length_664_cov_0.847788_1_plen_76_part_10
MTAYADYDNYGLPPLHVAASSFASIASATLRQFKKTSERSNSANPPAASDGPAIRAVSAPISNARLQVALAAPLPL